MRGNLPRVVTWQCIIAEEQAGVRAGRDIIVDQIFVVRQLSEKFYKKNRTLYNNFIDFKQAFDSVWQELAVAGYEELWNTGAIGSTA